MCTSWRNMIGRLQHSWTLKKFPNPKTIRVCDTNKQNNNKKPLYLCELVIWSLSMCWLAQLGQDRIQFAEKGLITEVFNYFNYFMKVLLHYLIMHQKRTPCFVYCVLHIQYYCTNTNKYNLTPFFVNATRKWRLFFRIPTRL